MGWAGIGAENRACEDLLIESLIAIRFLKLVSRPSEAHLVEDTVSCPLCAWLACLISAHLKN